MSKILIATPCYHAEVSLNFMASLLYQTPKIVAAGHEVQFIFTAGDAVNRQRNHLVAEFLNTDCSHLLFVDSDTGFNGEDINRMLAAGVPVVGVNYPKREYFWQQAGGETIADMRDSLLRGSVVVYADPQPVVGGMVPCAFMGMGVALIARQVFETIAAKKLVQALKGGQHRHFAFEVSQGEDFGEDYNFCNLCRQAGFTVYYDPAASASHMGWHEFKGRPQPAGIASANPNHNQLAGGGKHQEEAQNG
jgi:hypothetical protein